MRMSCNSTYLLDQETDHGIKADELAALLDGLFVEPRTKAVVFSQWTRTHDIVIRRLRDRNIGYVSFHGGVPSDKRPALLEQRIGRIHRMGQKRPVQIVNFVAKGTIEEGMLSVLAFKRSLAAGILDGGQGEISLGGSRLSRFMKEVESVTGHMGEGEAMAPSEGEATSAAAASGEVPVEPSVIDEPVITEGAGQAAATTTSAPGTDPWAACCGSERSWLPH